VWNEYAKRGKYRETPIPEELASSVQTISYDRDPDELRRVVRNNEMISRDQVAPIVESSG